MKKLWMVLALVFALLFCLTACGKKEADSSSVDLIVEDSASQAEAPSQDFYDDIPSYTTNPADNVRPAPASAPASESKSSQANPNPHPASTPATAGLPLLPVFGTGLVVCLFLLLREMRKKY